MVPRASYYRTLSACRCTINGCCSSQSLQNGWDANTNPHRLYMRQFSYPENVVASTAHAEESVSMSPQQLENNFEKDDSSSHKKYAISKNVPLTLSTEASYMHHEIAALKDRLKQLKERNADERRKLNEELSHRIWQSNNSEVRQMESDRLQHFVKNAWIDQRRWKEDEKLRKELEEKKFEEEAMLIREKQEAEERKQAEDKQAKREEYQRDLEKQLSEMKALEGEKSRLETVADQLMMERDRLLAIVDRREQQLQTRKARNLAVSWARQHHIKLRQRALQVMQELREDETLIRDFMELQHRADSKERLKQDDLLWVIHVLEEHKKLEELREKEYDLLFSEEASRLWRVREQQWEAEEAARQKLLSEVLSARQVQVDEKIKARVLMEDELKKSRDKFTQRVARVEEKILLLETQSQTSPPAVASPAEDSSRVSSRVQGLLDTESEARHRKEIARLEAEMAKLWGPLYRQPHYGRKKVQW